MKAQTLKFLLLLFAHRNPEASVPSSPPKQVLGRSQTHLALLGPPGSGKSSLLCPGPQSATTALKGLCYFPDGGHKIMVRVVVRMPANEKYSLFQYA